jgi:hypothetical protein
MDQLRMGPEDRGSSDDGFRLTERDVQLLAWVAKWRLVLAAQVRAKLGLSAPVVYRRLRGMVGLGVLSYSRIFHAQPGVYQVTNGGLAIADSTLARPRIDLRTYRHDLGVVWLSILLERETARAPVRVLSEREMRSLDRCSHHDREYQRLGVTLPGTGPAGQPRVHYPDLAGLDGDGRRSIAVELELVAKGRRRLEQTLAAYARDRSVDRVQYFVERAQVGHAVEQAARRVGAERLVEVHRFEWGAELSRSATAERPVSKT